MEGKNDVGNKKIMSISDIKNISACNQEGIEIDLIEYPYSINKKNFIINSESPSIQNKKLKIFADINFDSDGLFKTEMSGYIKKDKKTDDDEQIDNTTSHNIEIVRTFLNETIEIEFNDTYTNMPGVIINIDEKNTKLYKNYSTEYIKNESNKYIGVTITFSYLKVRKTYPEINIIIIGDAK